jgi:hypothetical protein
MTDLRDVSVRPDGSIGVERYRDATIAAIAEGFCPADSSPLTPGGGCHHPCYGGDWVIWDHHGYVHMMSEPPMHKLLPPPPPLPGKLAPLLDQIKEPRDDH